jgi:short-subunit dehydrogenase
MNMVNADSSSAASESSRQRRGEQRWVEQRRGSDSGPACVVITGASSGLGAGLARAYASPGRILGLIGRNASRLAAVADTCRQHGAVVETAVLDVTDAAAVAAWLVALDTRSPIDLLIANAGISAGTRPDGRLEGSDAAREVVQVNLLGVIHCVEALLPNMLVRRRGQIAVVASMAAYRGLPDSPAYCASKAGVLAYGESLRAGLEPFGVRVSVIVPGFFASPMSSRYGGRKLFLLSEARAVGHVMRGLTRRARRIVFPWQLAVLLRLTNLLPVWCGDRIMRAFPFRIAVRPGDRF